MTEKTAAVFRYIAYLIEMIVAFILLATPNLLPELFGAKPVLLVCVALTVAVYEHEIPAMIFGALAGAMIDLGSSNAIGMFTITLTVICFIIGYAANNLIVATFLNFLLTAAVVTAILFGLYYLLEFVGAGFDPEHLYFTAHILPRAILTFVFAIPYYFLNRFIYQTLSDTAQA